MIKKQEGEIIINKQFFIHIKKNVTVVNKILYQSISIIVIVFENSLKYRINFKTEVFRFNEFNFFLSIYRYQHFDLF